MTDYKDLIAAARTGGNRNAVDDWPELAASLIVDLADALESVLRGFPHCASCGDSPAPVVDREDLALMIGDPELWEEHGYDGEKVTDAILASGILRDAREVEDAAYLRGKADMWDDWVASAEANAQARGTVPGPRQRNPHRGEEQK